MDANNCKESQEGSNGGTLFSLAEDEVVTNSNNHKPTVTQVSGQGHKQIDKRGNIDANKLALELGFLKDFL